MGLFGKTIRSLELGDKVPAFSLLDHNGNLYNFDTRSGSKGYVIFFYPKDETQGCTREVCSFRDQYDIFAEAGVEVIGINSGSVESHKRFHEKHGLHYRLLSDPGNNVAHAFGVKNVLFLTGRETFVINRNSEIVYKFRNMFQAEDHVKNVLSMLPKLG